MNDVNDFTVKPHTEQTPTHAVELAELTNYLRTQDQAIAFLTPNEQTRAAEWLAALEFQQQRIAALTAALRDNVIYGHEVGGDPKRPGKICSLCCGEWEMAALESHAPDCLLGSAK